MKLIAPSIRASSAMRLCWALLASVSPFSLAQAADWREAFGKEVERIDAETPGKLGLYVKRLDNGEAYAYQADRGWYLSSSAKLPVAIALLQEVEAGKRKLDEKLVLKETDKVDGSGDLVWQPVGTTRRLDALLERMLMVSDNTAANLLIRTMGEDTLNQRARALLADKDFQRITTFTQVRYDVYGELHPSARKLSNLQLVQIAGLPMAKRADAVVRLASIDRAALQAKTIEEAYDRYYARQLNTATLQAYGGMLEKLVRGQLLKPPAMQLLYKDLKYDTYDAYRLEAGLPKTVRFIHKTGTQLSRACHMGVISPQDQGRNAIVVATCAEGLDEHKQAGDMFERLGRAITQALLTPAKVATVGR